MILIDSNSLILLLLGQIDPNAIKLNKNTKNLDQSDFLFLCNEIGSYENLLVLPHIWTEVDNLLNRLGYHYELAFRKLSSIIREEYVQTMDLIQNRQYIAEIGLTDSVILALAIKLKCEKLITMDSALENFAVANGIKVYNPKERFNRQFR